MSNKAGLPLCAGGGDAAGGRGLAQPSSPWGLGDIGTCCPWHPHLQWGPHLSVAQVPHPLQCITGQEGVALTPPPPTPAGHSSHFPVLPSPAQAGSGCFPSIPAHPPWLAGLPPPSLGSNSHLGTVPHASWQVNTNQYHPSSLSQSGVPAAVGWSQPPQGMAGIVQGSPCPGLPRGPGCLNQPPPRLGASGAGGDVPWGALATGSPSSRGLAPED